MTHVVTLSTPYSRTKAHMLIRTSPMRLDRGSP